MSHIAADLIANVAVTGAATAAAELAGLQTAVSSAGASAAAASGGIDALDASLRGLGMDAGIADANLGALGANALAADAGLAGAGAAALGAENGLAGAGREAGTAAGKAETLAANADTAGANLAAAGAAAAAAEPQIANAGRAAEDTGRKFGGANLAVIGLGAAMLGLIGIGADMASKFDYTLTTIEGKLQVLGGATKNPQADMEALRTKALELGRDTVFSAGQAADAMLAFARAGRPVKEIIDNDAQAALNLAGAVDATVPEAATTIANMMNVFNLKGPEAAHAADVLTVAVLKSGQPLSAMGTSLGQAANIAASLHIPFSDVAAVLADFMRSGIQASTAGSTFKTVLDHLISPSKAAKQIMDEYNITLFDSKGNFIGVSALAQEMKDKFGNLSPEMQAQIAYTLGLQRGQQALMVWMREGSSAIDQNTAEMNKAHPAADLMAIKMDTLTGAMHQLKGSIDTVLIIMGSTFVPMIRSAADHLTHLANAFINLDPHTQQFIAKAFAATGAALAFSGGVSALGGPLATLLGPMKALGGVLAEMGPWGIVAAAGVAAFALAWTRDWFGIQERVHSGLQALGPAFDEAKRGADSFAQSVGQKGLGTALTQAVNSLVAAAPQFESAAGKLLLGLVQGFEAHWHEFPGKIANLLAHVQFDIGDVMGYLTGTAIKLIAGLVIGIATHWKEILTTFAKLMLDLPAFLMTLGKDLLVEVPKAMIEGFINGLDQAFPGLKQKLSDEMHEAIDWVKSILGISSPSTVFNQIGQDLITGLANGLAAAWSLVTTAIQNAIQWILQQFAPAAQWLVSAGGNVIAGLYNGLNGALSMISAAISQTISDILTPFANAGSWLSDIGGQIVQGLADGITGAAGQVTSAVGYIAGLIPSGIAGLLGINSPSRVMADLAVGIPEGIAQGMTNGVALIHAATATLVQAATPNLAGAAYAPGVGSAAAATTYATTNAPMNVTINVNGNQPNSGIVNDIIGALGMARSQQVGLLGPNG